MRFLENGKWTEVSDESASDSIQETLTMIMVEFDEISRHDRS